MISYSRDPKQEIPASAVKIFGLGGAGANMLERIALDSIEGAQLVSLNTDSRTLSASLAKEKIQLGLNLTKGLGTGGDPELGQQAVLEAEDEVRDAIKGQRIVFLCVGLGGGTGSGAAPILARIAREEGAFVIVFATMPFLFEGSRRREQAEIALNQLAVLSNALMTFDNSRMGELVLAKQGIHEAFGAADKMISESIKAVIRLVVKPGLIHIGLDELITALRSTRSRCLFGSGIADGKDRASKALRNALASPLLDQGALLKDAQSVLVHLSGGESLTLFEIELLMQSLQKHVPDHAQILFGAAIDASMGDYLSITLISSLPEDALASSAQNTQVTPVSEPAKNILSRVETPKPTSPALKPTKKVQMIEPAKPTSMDDIFDDIETKSPEPPSAQTPELELRSQSSEQDTRPLETTAPLTETTKKEAYDRPFAESDLISQEASKEVIAEPHEVKPEPPVTTSTSSFETIQSNPSSLIPEAQDDLEVTPSRDPKVDFTSSLQLKLGSKHPSDQNELSFKKTPRGRFEGENSNVINGEDLDLPPFLRKKK
jgi:cell division protein FtsZ